MAGAVSGPLELVHSRVLPEILLPDGPAALPVSVEGPASEVLFPAQDLLHFQEILRPGRLPSQQVFEGRAMPAALFPLQGLYHFQVIRRICPLLQQKQQKRKLSDTQKKSDIFSYIQTIKDPVPFPESITNCNLYINADCNAKALFLSR